MDQDPDQPGDIRDQDVVEFQPRRRRQLSGRRRAVVFIVAAFLAGGVAGGAVAVSLRSPSTQEASRPARTTVTTTITQLPGTFVRVPEPVDPKSSYIASCGIQGDEFTATVSFGNRGNVGLAYRVTVNWATSGQSAVTRTAEEQIPPAQVRTIHVHAPATADETSANRSTGLTRDACHVRIDLLSSFGSSYR